MMMIISPQHPGDCTHRAHRGQRASCGGGPPTWTSPSSPLFQPGGHGGCDEQGGHRHGGCDEDGGHGGCGD